MKICIGIVFVTLCILVYSLCCAAAYEDEARGLQEWQDELEP